MHQDLERKRKQNQSGIDKNALTSPASEILISNSINYIIWQQSEKYADDCQKYGNEICRSLRFYEIRETFFSKLLHFFSRSFAKS